MQVLIAEDDQALGIFLRRALEGDGHEVRLASDGQTAMDMFLANSPDLALLDLNLPRKDGLEVLSFLRSITEELPVLILTARQETETRIHCLDLGADDCMVKPFSLQELRARTRALLRRRREAGVMIRCAGVELNRMDRTVLRAGQSVPLTNKEFALLEYLMLHRGNCIPRAVLLKQVWDTDTGTNVVDVYINYLRRKLNDDSSVIQTVRGQGYRIAGLHLGARERETQA